MKCIAMFTATIVVAASLAFAEGLFKTGGEFKPFEKQRFTVRRTDLNKPMSPHRVHFHIATGGEKAERYLSLIVTIDRCSTRHAKVDRDVPGQIKPDAVYWQTRDVDGVVHRQWEPHFEDRSRAGPGDTIYTTCFALPASELKQSHLLLYFADIDRDGKEDNVTFDLDMTDFDWAGMPSKVIEQQ